MRRGDKEISDPKIIKEFLETSNICRIALFDKDYPYIVTMNYGFENGALYFHSALKGKKIELIQQNSKAGFSIELEHQIVEDEVSCNWTTHYKSVVGAGEFEFINDKETKRKCLSIIMNQHGRPNDDFSDVNVDKIQILKLIIKSVSAKQSG